MDYRATDATVDAIVTLPSASIHYRDTVILELRDRARAAGAGRRRTGAARRGSGP